ncbi:hypothetical protein AJ80_03175 [Polytolypa hystricis UAMH7299]|uniref:Myosin class II heavy chain n=1 Tax=Polytolypa hystricis (strain UAMH7299) TaxID=1447883 RepID=A0A2B7YLL1_POLH7|nr:hypothetical protein AJ80_03175 [Polytolypa hystricis UAMH7299]
MVQHLAYPKFDIPCVKIPGTILKSGKQVLAAVGDTETSHLAVDSANPAFHFSPAPVAEQNSPAQNRSTSTASLLQRSVTPGPSSLRVVPTVGQYPITSPQLSPLPTLPKYPRDSESLLSSSPEHKRAESSYYTAAWGSPYATPSPRRLSWSLKSFQGNLSPGARDTSPTSMRSGRPKTSGANNNDSLRPEPPRLSKRFYGSIGRGRSSRQGGKTIKDFTQDWINQYLSGQPRTERTNWLSDDSGESEAGSFWTARNHLGEDQSEGWLGLEDDREDEDHLKTPTTTTFFARKAKATSARSESLRPRVSHISKKSTDTLTQEDFWDFGHDQVAMTTPLPDKEDAQTGPDSMMKESRESPPIDKPLPPAPAAEAASLSQQPGPSSIPATRTHKRKIPRRNRQYVIGLPRFDQRGTVEKLLTPIDVENRLKDWEAKGYNTQAFDAATPDAGEGISSSRPLFPDPADNQKAWSDGTCNVHFPDHTVWEAYVEFLKEEKLRALGVFLDEPAPVPTPGSLPMSQTPSQFAIPGITPPIPASSAASNPFNNPTTTFSPAFNQSTQASSQLGSLASPSSPFGMPGVSTLSNQPSILGTDIPLSPGYPFLPFQPTPPAQGTFTPQSFFNLPRNGISPVGTTNLQNLNGVVAPVSPLVPEDVKGFPGTNNIFSQLRHQVPSQSIDLSQDDAATLISPPSDKSAVRIEADSDTIESSSGPEIAHPTPRGHRHNVSETLQKGVEQSDYHLEDSIRRQLEEEDAPNPQDGLMKSRWAIPEDNERPPERFLSNIQTDPSSQQLLFGERYQNDHLPLDDAEINTNPSLSASPAHGDFGHQNIMGSQTNSFHRARASTNSFQPRHRSRTSVSTLNVEAQEFDPTASFGFNDFSFGGNSFQPASNFQATSSIFSPGLSQNTSHSATSSNFNIAAVPFGHREPISSTSNFKFSAASFNVDAPAFNPGASLSSQTDGNSFSNTNTSASSQPKIFNNFDALAPVVKPDKRSKAIPIIRPEEVQKPSPAPEDKSSTEMDPAQFDQGRQKRVRHGKDDGNQEPLFATPVELPAEDKDVVTTNALSSNDAKLVDDEGTSASIAPGKSIDAAVPASTLNTGRNEKRPNEDTEEPADQASTKPATDIPKALAEDMPSVVEKKSSILKPTAAPFEFKPALITSAPKERPIKQPSLSRKSAGLEASRYAVLSPPQSPTPSPKYSPAQPPPEKLPEAPSPPRPSDDSLSEELPESEKDGEHDSLDEQEIDAVMRQLNEDDSDIGIERSATPLQPQHAVHDQGVSEALLSGLQLAPPSVVRSGAPSPSTPGTPVQTHDLPKLNTGIDIEAPHVLSPQKSVQTGNQSPVRHLNNPDLEEHISDWDDAISSGEDEKLQHRSRFFDTHVNDIVGNILEDRLDPLERTLSVIQHSVALLASRSVSQSQSQRRSETAEVEHSDADDEDDEEPRYRSISPYSKKDRRVDKIKQAVLEALSTSQAIRKESKDMTPPVELGAIHSTLAELKELAVSKPPEAEPIDLVKVIEEAISNHPKLNVETDTIDYKNENEKLKLQIDGLQSMLRLADERAEKEHRSRRDVQDSLAECQRLLKFAEEDASSHRDASLKADAALSDLRDRKLPEIERIEKQSALLQENQADLQVTLAELSDKNIALQGTLDEYRISGDQWRSEIQSVKSDNKELRRTIGLMKSQMESSMGARQALRAKFDQLQGDMVNATRDIARDQASWRKKEEDMAAKYNALKASYDREVRLREKLELDIADLEQQEKEATKLRFIFGQSQQENARLEDMVATLRQESHEYQTKAARFERDFNDARESSRVEIQRARTAMESELESANNQVNYIRAELESQLGRLQNQLESVQMDADTAKARHELLLEEARDAKSMALGEAADSKELALQEQRLLHERTLNDLRERHARALHNTSEDRQRGDSHLMELVALRDEKIHHLQDKVVHLEEKLEVAKSAARAAAQAARSAKGAPIASPNHTTSPSMSFSRGSDIPEKISPQALRESIIVLQDQLQQREGRLEELEHELSLVDKDAPNKIKDKETEINWLRELLGVRLDDLQDIITTLSQPSFNQQAVRDAAIRLRANLQMEQQVKERAMNGGGQTFPSLSSISNLAASPRAIPLAAAAAWGNWRKGRETSVTSNTPGSTGDHRTPSKSTNSQNFLSGLLTPPSSNVRQTPTNSSAPPANLPMGSRRTYSESQPLRSYSGSSSGQRALSSRQAEKMPALAMEPPSTPPLLRKSSYDRDAEAASYGDSAYGDDSDSMMGGIVSRDELISPSEEPFGPAI